MAASPSPAGTRKCLLGGAPELFSTTGSSVITPDSTVTDAAVYPMGFWKKRRAGAMTGLSAVRSDAAYLIPLGANVNFKGVVFVQGDVAVSGKLRGRVSVFATGNIILADDLLYHNAPGTKCDAEGDIMGSIATLDAIIADNNVQTPFHVAARLYGGFDDTPARRAVQHVHPRGRQRDAGNDRQLLHDRPDRRPGPIAPVLPHRHVRRTATAERCARRAGRLRPGHRRHRDGSGRLLHLQRVTSSYAYGYAEAHSYDPLRRHQSAAVLPDHGTLHRVALLRARSGRG